MTESNPEQTTPSWGTVHNAASEREWSLWSEQQQQQQQQGSSAPVSISDKAASEPTSLQSRVAQLGVTPLGAGTTPTAASNVALAAPMTSASVGQQVVGYVLQPVMMPQAPTPMVVTPQQQMMIPAQQIQPQVLMASSPSGVHFQQQSAQQQPVHFQQQTAQSQPMIYTIPGTNQQILVMHGQVYQLNSNAHAMQVPTVPSSMFMQAPHQPQPKMSPTQRSTPSNVMRPQQPAQHTKAPAPPAPVKAPEPPVVEAQNPATTTEQGETSSPRTDAKAESTEANTAEKKAEEPAKQFPPINLPAMPGKVIAPASATTPKTVVPGAVWKGPIPGAPLPPSPHVPVKMVIPPGMSVPVAVPLTSPTMVGSTFRTTPVSSGPIPNVVAAMAANPALGFQMGGAPAMVQTPTGFAVVMKPPFGTPIVDQRHASPSVGKESMESEQEQAQWAAYSHLFDHSGGNNVAVAPPPQSAKRNSEPGGANHDASLQPQ